MGKTFSSWGALEGELQERLAAATEEAVNEIYLDLQQNVRHFYDSPGGSYKRTGNLGQSPRCSFSASGNTAAGEVYLDTGYQYHPSGIDTETIFRYAETGGLLGNGGFWERTEEDAKSHVQDAFRKYFG